jgi:geranylgeranylglycerol-phosphate geranylgeranyltransferase
MTAEALLARHAAAWQAAVVHPFPSALNALLVLALALLAGGTLPAAAGLALSMLALQFAIGAANDVFDFEHDAATKPTKPLPRGLMSRTGASILAVLCAALALGLAFVYGPVVLLLAGLMLSAGLVYDAYLKRGPWAWTAFSVAFPILPLYAWYGASGLPPPHYQLLLPMAVLAGPALHLANGLVDLERDRAAGMDTLAVRLGRRRSVIVMVSLLAVVHGAACSW